MTRVLTVLLAFTLLAVPALAQQSAELKTQHDKVSYTIGIDIGNSLKSRGIEVDPEKLAQGIADAMAGRQPVLSDEEREQVMNAFREEMVAKQMERRKRQATENQEEGEAFLAENEEKEGVQTTDSGLQYEVIRAGEGESPAEDDTVVAHYKGTLLDGTVFDSSYKRGEPASFPVSGVVPGWTEVLQLMKPGAKWRVYIPSDLAYGERGAGKAIGPNETLIFDIELLEVKQQAAGGGQMGRGQQRKPQGHP